jgi:pimeloyl-ACP methyl ester carboxylesterase
MATIFVIRNHDLQRKGISMRFQMVSNILQKTIIFALFMLPGMTATAQANPPIKNIVLVHGAWADGSSYSKIIPILVAKGFKVTAVQNPLSSFADDVAATNRAIDAQDGPVLLVGHSYGGAIITEAGNNPKVAALLFIAAFGPDTGETLATTAKGFPDMPAAAELRLIEDKFLVMTETGIRKDFAQDLTPVEQNLLFVTQGPTSELVFGAPITNAAWHTKPSWYVVSANDRTINPNYERFAAKRMGAKVLTLPSSHVAMLAKPKEVAAFVIEATGSATQAAHK